MTETAPPGLDVVVVTAGAGEVVVRVTELVVCAAADFGAVGVAALVVGVVGVGKVGSPGRSLVTDVAPLRWLSVIAAGPEHPAAAAAAAAAVITSPTTRRRMFTDGTTSAIGSRVPGPFNSLWTTAVSTPLDSRPVTPMINTDDLCDAQGVADLVGLRHANSVHTYLRRYPDMPRPVIELGPGRPRLWLRPAIEAWLVARIGVAAPGDAEVEEADGVGSAPVLVGDAGATDSVGAVGVLR